MVCTVPKILAGIGALHLSFPSPVRAGDSGSFGKVYKEHRAQMSGKKRKRRLINGGPCEQFIVSDDLDLLWSADLPTETAEV
jgi:hypothetical protein